MEGANLDGQAGSCGKGIMRKKTTKKESKS